MNSHSTRPERSPDCADLLRRLRCAEGHLHAVTAMLETGQPCDQTLHQLQAVQAALAKVAANLVQCEARACVEALRQPADPEETLHRLRRLFPYLNGGP